MAVIKPPLGGKPTHKSDKVTTFAPPTPKVSRQKPGKVLSAAERAAYDAPFPDDSYKAAARVFPSLVPTRPDSPSAIENAEAWEILRHFERPWLCAFSDSDPITGGGDRIFLERIPGARSQHQVTIVGAGHFLQEDQGPQLAAAIIEFVGNS